MRIVYKKGKVVLRPEWPMRLLATLTRARTGFLFRFGLERPEDRFLADYRSRLHPRADVMLFGRGPALWRDIVRPAQAIIERDVASWLIKCK